MKSTVNILSGLLPLVCAVSGCANPADSGPDGPYFDYPAGSQIRLEQALEIPPEQATVRVQWGRPVARNGVEEVEPHCILEVNEVRDTAQVVAPDRFDIVRVERRSETFGGLPVGPMAGMGLGRDQPSHVYYKTLFHLRSANQPNVRSLTCQSNQMAAGIAIMRHLTLPEMRQAVGPYFRFLLPN